MAGLGNHGSWHMPDGRKPPREPMFNLPTPILVLGGLMLAIQALREFVLSAADWQDILLTFSFIPIRYSGSFDFPGGVGADIWTSFTYAFLHGSWMHLILNLIWMGIFGTVVVRRLGTGRFVAFFIVTAAAGALLHYVLHSDSNSPLVGVSAVLSGAIAGYIRFGFAGGVGGFPDMMGAYRAPCQTLEQLWQNKRAMMFIGIWLGLNLLFGLFSLGGGGGSIAWQAHLGGFIAGLFVFPYLDPMPKWPGSGGGARKREEPKPAKRPDYIKVVK